MTPGFNPSSSIAPIFVQLLLFLIFKVAVAVELDYWQDFSESQQEDEIVE